MTKDFATNSQEENYQTVLNPFWNNTKNVASWRSFILQWKVMYCKVSKKLCCDSSKNFQIFEWSSILIIHFSYEIRLNMFDLLRSIYCNWMTHTFPYSCRVLFDEEQYQMWTLSYDENCVICCVFFMLPSSIHIIGQQIYILQFRVGFVSN